MVVVAALKLAALAEIPLRAPDMFSGVMAGARFLTRGSLIKDCPAFIAMACQDWASPVDPEVKLPAVLSARLEPEPFVLEADIEEVPEFPDVFAKRAFTSSDLISLLVSILGTEESISGRLGIEVADEEADDVTPNLSRT